MKKGKLLKFLDMGDLTVYNTTPPLWLLMEGVKKRLIAGRVEDRNRYTLSRIFFFEEYKPYTYNLLDKSPIFWGEDPVITTVWTEQGEEIILGVVEPHAFFPHSDKYILNTAFYRGTDIAGMERFVEVPGKDNRLVQKKRGREKRGPIAFCNRPQGIIGGLGTIGYKEFETLEQISKEGLRDAVLLEDMFPEGWWGGANELHYLPKNNRIGIIAHAAHERFPWIEEPEIDCKLFKSATGWTKSYIIIYTELNCSSMQFTIPEVIASRKDFPAHPGKISVLDDVSFPSGISFESEGPMLYSGLGDSCEGVIPISHPAILNMYSK